MKLLTTVVAAAAISLGSMASAASWDFAQDAIDYFNSEGHEGSFDQVYGGMPADGGGVTVDATAFNHNVDKEGVHPFLDGLSGGKPAGLGVCSSGFSANGDSNCATGNPQATNTGDDNLVFPEILQLTFSKQVFLKDLFIRDGKHNPLTGMLAVMTELHDVKLLSIVAGVVQDPESAGYSSVFYFSSDPAAGGKGQIYLDSVIASAPIPAAGWLMIAGLGGMAAMKRRKKA